MAAQAGTECGGRDRPGSRFTRAVAAVGALLAAGAVALSAYASHAAAGPEQTRLLLAAGIGLAHGVALAALPASSRSRIAHAALAALLVGAMLFCGSLVAAHFLGTPTRMAPMGGTLMIAGWLLQAVAAARR